MKHYFSLLFLPVCLSVAHASATPTHCPDLKAIQALSLNYVKASDGYRWVTAYTPGDTYGTSQQWIFTLLGGSIGEAKTAEQALKRAKQILSTLGKPIGPHSDDGKQWECRYSSDFLTVAMAFTPVIDISNW